MKKNILAIALFSTFFTNAQVGIGTAFPKATVEIAANATDLTLIDGIIPPKLTGNDLETKHSLYGPDQKGAFVYVTEAISVTPSPVTVDIDSPGYYYFNGLKWEKFGSQNNSKKWFYSPSIALPTTSKGIVAGDTDISYDATSEIFTINLYSIYKKQFSSNSIKSNTNSALAPYSNASDLDYFITYFDPTVYIPSSINLLSTGELTYKVDPTGVVTQHTFMNIIFKEKE